MVKTQAHVSLRPERLPLPCHYCPRVKLKPSPQFCLFLPFRKAHLILRRLERVSRHCSSLLRSAHIQSRVDTVPYLFCRSEEVRPAGMVWYSILKDTRITCEEKMVSMARNMYGEAKGR